MFCCAQDISGWRVCVFSPASDKAQVQVRAKGAVVGLRSEAHFRVQQTAIPSSSSGGWCQKGAFPIDPHVKIADFTSSVNMLKAWCQNVFSSQSIVSTPAHTLRGVNFFLTLPFYCYQVKTLANQGAETLSDRSEQLRGQLLRGQWAGSRPANPTWRCSGRHI